MQSGRKEVKGRRTVVLLLAGALTFLIAYSFTRPLGDFVEYWSAAHLLVSHQNPYSFPATLKIEKALAWKFDLPLIAPNPPWAMPFFAPLGLVHSYALGWAVWVLFMTMCIALSSRMLMDLYFGEIRIPEISDAWIYRALFAFTFFPTLLCLQFGQISPLVLLGVTGFLWFDKHDRPWIAGAMLALAGVKPHLVYLVWLAVLISHRKRWNVLLAAALTITFLSAIPLAIDRHVFAEYREFSHTPYLRLFASGIFAGIRSRLGSDDRFWFQFLPTAAGLVWFGIYWPRHHRGTQWVAAIPILVVASVLTSPWGFLFDQVVLVIPIIAIAAYYAKSARRFTGMPLISYTTLNVLLIVLVCVGSFWTYLPAAAALAIWFCYNPRSAQFVAGSELVNPVGSVSD